MCFRKQRYTIFGVKLLIYLYYSKTKIDMTYLLPAATRTREYFGFSTRNYPRGY